MEGELCSQRAHRGQTVQTLMKPPSADPDCQPATLLGGRQLYRLLAAELPSPAYSRGGKTEPLALYVTCRANRRSPRNSFEVCLVRTATSACPVAAAELQAQSVPQDAPPTTLLFSSCASVSCLFRDTDNFLLPSGWGGRLGGRMHFNTLGEIPAQATVTDTA